MVDKYEELEHRTRLMEEKNTKEHGRIIKELESAVANIKWMNLIGKWVLTVMLGYYIIVGYYIFSQDTVTHKELKEVVVIGHKNTEIINSLEGKFSILIDILKRKEKNDGD